MVEGWYTQTVHNPPQPAERLGPYHPAVIADAAGHARDLTDPAQNLAVLEAASLLISDPMAGPRIERDHGPAVAAEAAAVARSRRRLAQLKVPVHLGVVWAMYGETGRMVPRSAHPHGEDFVRAKVAQLDWLADGLPGLSWSILAVDDGCPDHPSSAEVMSGIAETEGYPTQGHRSVTVLRLAQVIAAHAGISPAFARLTSTQDSRKGGSILAGLDAALRTGPAPASESLGSSESSSGARHVLCYTDADLSANLAQLGTLAAPIVAGDGVAAVLGQRYGVPGAVLIKESGPSSEPHSTGDKPDKLIILFRHFVRAMLMPSLAHVLDTQAGFKAFDAAMLAPALRRMTSFNETFDVELLIHLAQQHGAGALAVEPIVFTEDLAATNFPSVDPGERHLAMVREVVDVYDRFVAPHAPAVGEASELLDLVRTLDLKDYVALIGALRTEDAGDPTLFDRRWPIAQLRGVLGR